MENFALSVNVYGRGFSGRDDIYVKQIRLRCVLRGRNRVFHDVYSNEGAFVTNQGVVLKLVRRICHLVGAYTCLVCLESCPESSETNDERHEYAESGNAN